MLGFSSRHASTSTARSLAEESSKGGVVAALIGRPDLDKVSLKLAIKGDRAGGSGDFTAAAGDALDLHRRCALEARWRSDGHCRQSQPCRTGLARRADRPPAARARDAQRRGDAGRCGPAHGAAGPRSMSGRRRSMRRRATTPRPTSSRRQSTLRAGEAGPLDDLAGGVTWRNAQVERQSRPVGPRRQAAGLGDAHGIGRRSRRRDAW